MHKPTYPRDGAMHTDQSTSACPTVRSYAVNYPSESYVLRWDWAKEFFSNNMNKTFQHAVRVSCVGTRGRRGRLGGCILSLLSAQFRTIAHKAIVASQIRA